MIQVLVEFGGSRKVLLLHEEDENTCCTYIKDTFGIDGEIVLQKYNTEWQEYIDLELIDVIADKNKLCVIAKVNSYIGFEY